MAKNTGKSDTPRLHLTDDPEQNARIMNACQQQRGLHNRTVKHLITQRSDEALNDDRDAGVSGVFRHWSAWRTKSHWMMDISTIVVRGAMADAYDQVAEWKATNHAHAVVNEEHGEDSMVVARRLYRKRKVEHREGRHRCRIDQDVRRTGARTLDVPGVGTVTVEEDLPDNLDIHSCVITERTPPLQLKKKPEPEERTFEIHLSEQKPALSSPD